MDPGSAALAAVGIEVAEIASALATDYAARKAARKAEELTGIPLTEGFRSDPVGNKVEELVDSLLSRPPSKSTPTGRQHLPYFSKDQKKKDHKMSALPTSSPRTKSSETRTAKPRVDPLVKSRILVAAGNRRASSLENRAIPAAQGGIYTQRPARMTSHKDGTVSIHHTEFLGDGDVHTNPDPASGGDFHLHEFTINPSNPVTFPWLSGIASNFERYELDWVKVHYVPRIGTTTIGSVMMAPDFDVNDPVPADSSELTQMKGAVEGPAFDSFTLHLPGASLHTSGPLYTRGSIRAGDNRLSDAANVYIATAGNSAVNATLGRMFVEYKVRLLDPHDGTHDELLPAAQMVCLQADDTSRAVTTSPTFSVVGNSTAGFGDWTFPAGLPYADAYVGKPVTGDFRIPRGTWQVTYHMEFTSPGAAHIYSELQQFDGTTWAKTPFTNTGGGTATIADPGSVSISGVLLQNYDASTGAGWLRVTVFANTSLTLTDLNYVLCFIPA